MKRKCEECGAMRRCKKYVVNVNPGPDEWKVIYVCKPCQLEYSYGVIV